MTVYSTETFNMKDYIKNKELSAELKKALDSSDLTSPLFCIVGDLSVKGTYGEALLAVSQNALCAISGNGEVILIPFSEIENTHVKRMYGSARITLTKKNGEKIKLFRFSYTVCALCEAACAFINSVSSGADVNEELEKVEDAFRSRLLVCPKCGRTLLRAGAECLKCQSKNTVLSKLMRYVLPHKRLLTVTMILSFLYTAFALIPPYITKILVDDVFTDANMANGGDAGRKMLAIIVGVLGTSYIIIFVLNGFKNYWMRVVGDRIVKSLRDDVYRKAQYLPMSFYDKTATGAVINRISSDTSTLQAFVLRVTQEAVMQFFLLIGIVIIMLFMDWRLTLLSLIPVPFIVLGTRFFRKRIAPFYRRIWRRWSAVTSILTDTIPCVRVVKAFAGEERSVDKFEKYNNEWYKTDIRSAKITIAFPLIVTFLIHLGNLVIWGIGGNWVIDGLLTPGLLVSFLSYTSIFYQPINFFANLSDTYQSALAAAERILDIIDADPEADAGKGNIPEKVNGKIEFRNVNFSFDKSKKTLSDINLTIEPGDIVGIVGTTGSGKSTLINLLMRFYDSYEGEILLDGQNIKDIDISYYRSCIGYVQQEPMMFSDTIYNNIAYGCPNCHVEQVIHAADVANAHTFIANQPDGYDSMLGERGVGLSGGEKQRISIARAVLKNPSILIFDEATAAVDSETENLIQEAIEHLISGRTTLMIAHRLSTLRKANKIVVVDNGKIIECGSHDELMALNGKYRRLIEIQSMSEKLSKSKKEENLD